MSMPGTEKNRLSKKNENPAPVCDSSNKDKTGAADDSKQKGAPAEVEIGGRKGLDPTRYGDW